VTLASLARFVAPIGERQALGGNSQDVSVRVGSRRRLDCPGRGFLRGFGHGAAYRSNTTTTINGIAGNPINGETGWAPSATFQNDVNPSLGNYLFVNTGSGTSATWTNIL